MKLFRFFRKEKNSNRTNENLKGYVYYSVDEDKRFSEAKAGDIIKNKSNRPPWIVVDHDLNSIIVTKWPGKLFEVEVLNQSNEKKLNKGLVKDVWYTRTLGVKIIREIPLENLFGDNGVEICQIINITRNITVQQVISLSKFKNDDSREIYSKAWEKWIAIYDKESSYATDKHYDTLKIFINNNRHISSPIKQGLAIIASQLDSRAREILGKEAFIIDKGEEYLISEWANAMEKLLHAGMAEESESLLTLEEKEILTKPFRETFTL